MFQANNEDTRTTSFLAFGLNTERYEVSLRIQSECGKGRRSSVFIVNFEYEMKIGISRKKWIAVVNIFVLGVH